MSIRKLSVIILTGLFLSGCSINIGGSKKTATDESTTGGIFMTADQGNSWQHLGVLSSVKTEKVSLFSVDTKVLRLDPSDSKALYWGTVNAGVFFSYDSGQSWQVSKKLGAMRVLDLAIDPKDKCTLFVATTGRVYKSTDCARTWATAYADNKKNAANNVVAIDHFDSQQIYVGDSNGDIIKSADGGGTWSNLHNFKKAVVRLVVDPKDSRILFVALKNGQLFKTADSGKTWTELTEKLKAFGADRGFRDLVASSAQAGLYFVAGDYGLFKTANYGDDWTEIKLVPTETKSLIQAAAGDPLDAKIIYYVTETTFYVSNDAGQTWLTRRLPTPRGGADLLVVPQEKTSVVYLGVSK